MPQFFLKGWVVGTPGNNSMEFLLPDGTVDCRANFHVQDEKQASHISFGTQFVETENNVSRDDNGQVIIDYALNVARISWTNNSTDDIFFDYEIIPFYASP